MDIVRKVVMFVLVLVIGSLIITTLIPPAVDEVLERPDTASFTGLQQFLQFLPMLAVLALVTGGLLLLFRTARRRDATGYDASLPPGYTRRPRLPWRQ